MKPIEKVTILGAGTMGARIAAHLANAGVASVLLDMATPGEPRNRVAQNGLQAAVKSKPAAFFDLALARLITLGNFDDDLQQVAASDWIIEAVIEDLDIKRALLKKVEALRRPMALVSTNTSGLPVARIAEGFSPEFRRFWLGTHFFNPPRYMRLLEIIPTPDTDAGALNAISRFCDLHLGKGIVLAKDTPNFIANRIGTFSVLNVMRLMREMDLSIEEADALTGTAVGWPKSATFRTIDMVGLDILGHVVRNMPAATDEETARLALPDFYSRMLQQNWLGDKTGGGFYKKIKRKDGDDERLAIDWKTLEYHPRQKPRFSALDMAKQVDDTPRRLRMILGLDAGQSATPKDKAAQFLWSALSGLWNYAANRVGEISDSIVEIDRAMRLGFNWELGPFELWDAAGVEATVARMKQQSQPVAVNAEKLLASGAKTWYQDSPPTASGRVYFDLRRERYEQVEVPAGVWSVQTAKKAKGVVKQNASTSLVDLGDGVAAFEFHSKLNVIGPDIVQLITASLRPGGAGDPFDAFVITNDAQHFCAGANIMLLLMAIQDEEWDDIDLMVRGFQQMTQAIKFSPKPVVVAPFGMTLGGGCEIALHGAARQPHAELYIGLVEGGVGLLPAGGGLKEMLLRAISSAEQVRPGGRGESVEMAEAMKRSFETVGMAKVSTSVAEARHYGFIGEGDQVTMNRDRVLADAKMRALELAREGYQPPVPRKDIPAPGDGTLALLKLGIHLLRQGEFISDHDAKIGIKIAEVLCGGNITPGTPVSEQYILDLEREGFKSLCGERKTQERIQHTLKTGRPLRN
jgi:3-hydroxyacyl-CoA dehydrogenase